MINAVLGLKQNMSNQFDRFGHRIPTTSILVSPNVVLKISEDKVQLGFGKRKKVKKPQSAWVSAAGYPPRFVREVSIKNTSHQAPASDVKYSVGDKVTVSIFSLGDLVKVTGVTKGKGFAGVVKRWGFAGGPKTHGQSDRHRAPGSIGQTTTPGRVFKGKRMAGHMGVAKQTIRGLEVVEVDESHNLLLVKGSLPGAKNNLLVIEKIGKVKGYTPPAVPKEVDKEKDQEKKAQTAQNGQGQKDQPSFQANKESGEPEGDQKKEGQIVPKN